jgi:hypothetical protein
VGWLRAESEDTANALSDLAFSADVEGFLEVVDAGLDVERG